MFPVTHPLHHDWKSLLSWYLTRVAEPHGQYRVTFNGEEWPRELRRIKLRTLRSAASGQFDRLLQLANLLCQSETTDRPTTELAPYAEEVRRATNALEDALHAILDPLAGTRRKRGRTPRWHHRKHLEIPTRAFFEAQPAPFLPMPVSCYYRANGGNSISY